MCLNLKKIINDEEFYLINIKKNQNYYITKNGKIFSTYTDKILKLKTDGDGYKEVTLIIDSYRKTCRVHRLVASTFLENNNDLPYINHINGLKFDNRIENLEWCTASHNNFHRFIINNIVHGDEDLFSVENLKNGDIQYLNWAELNKLVSWSFIKKIKNKEMKRCYQVFERNINSSISVYYNGEEVICFDNTNLAADYYNVKVNSISYYLNRKQTKTQSFSRIYRTTYLGKKSAETIETTL